MGTAVRSQRRVITRRIFLFGVLAQATAVCAAKAHQRGLAGWYGHGDGFDGKVTASGERFDKNRLTAAHSDLPFGTRVRVRNLRNNHRVDVTITDRLPVGGVNKGRIVDVSYAAAKKLRMVEAGLVPVELTIRS